MINPSNDRLDYGEILAPPSGYQLDFAIGTTYSLDFDALIGACLSLSTSEEADSIIAQNPASILEALRDTADKVALFCENGQIHCPNRVTSLYILLEKMVCPVTVEKREGIAAYPSFHPKLWLIRYANRKQEKKYRISVLSRNLTFDRSWDVSCCMDGEAGEEEIAKNEPLCDFLRYLIKRLPADDSGRRKSSFIQEMITDLRWVRFRLQDDRNLRRFRDYSFIPNGIEKATGGYYRFDDTPLFKNTFHEILIISPFLSEDIIESFNDRNKKSLIGNDRYMLITRRSSLAKLSAAALDKFKDGIYVLKDNVVDGESIISGENNLIQQQDIHAKMYMIRKSSESDLYIGSLNASHNAVYGNVEFMLCLHTFRSYLNMDIMKADLFGKDPDGPANPFERIEIEQTKPSEREDPASLLNDIVKDIVRGKPCAEVTADEAGNYDLRITSERIDTKAYEVTIRPLLLKVDQKLSNQVVFSGMTMLQLSQFFVVTVKDTKSDEETVVSRVIMIPTAGLPQEREREAVSSIIKDRNSFFQYVIFLLGEENILSYLETDKTLENEVVTLQMHPDQTPALYEKMLRTAASAPEKLDGITYLLNTISDKDVIPDSFRSLFEVFRKAVKTRD